MNSKVTLLINIVLAALAAFLVFKVYRLIMEPIEFEKIKTERFDKVKESLIDIREAQLLYRQEIGQFCGDVDVLAAFVDTGSITIVERKDTNFMKYNKKFGKEIMVDSIIVRVLGTEKVKKNRFGDNFKISNITTIPYSDNIKFSMGAGVIDRNGVKVPVFEALAEETQILYGLEKRFNNYIDKANNLAVGSLTQPTISGNWQ